MLSKSMANSVISIFVPFPVRHSDAGLLIITGENTVIMVDSKFHDPIKLQMNPLLFSQVLHVKAFF